jgi:hypothetical protein
LETAALPIELLAYDYWTELPAATRSDITSHSLTKSVAFFEDKPFASYPSLPAPRAIIVTSFHAEVARRVSAALEK